MALDSQTTAPSSSMTGMRPSANQTMGALIMDKILLAQGRHRGQPVRTGFSQANEQAKARHPGDGAVERGAHALGQEGRDVSFPGFALGGHGAPLGRRNVF